MDIADKANDIAKKFDTRDPFKICDALQIPVFVIPLIDLRGLYMREDNVDVIFVSDSLSDSTRSFVCGHELGHYIYDRGMNRPFLDRYTYYIPDKYENRADMFSAQLLWGKPPMYEEQYLNEWEMADCLNVAVCSVNTRLLELEIYY